MATSSWQQLIDSANSEEGKSGAGGGQPIPDGPYNFTIAEAKHQTASSGSEMVVVRMVVSDGPYAGKWVWNNFVLSEDNPVALNIFMRHMDAMGIGAQYINSLPLPPAVGLVTLAQWLVGRQGVMIVGQQVWNGKSRNEVKDVQPLGAAVTAGSPQPPAPTSAPTPVPPVAPLAPAAAPVLPAAPAPPVPGAPVAPAAPAAPAPVPPAAPSPAAVPAAPAPVATQPAPASAPASPPAQGVAAPAPGQTGAAPAPGAPPF